MTPKEIEKLDKCMENVRHETEKVLERESSASAVLGKVSAKMLALVAHYKMRGVVPHHHEVEECAAMLCAISIACTPEHAHETTHPEKDDAPALAHSRFK